MGCKWGGFLLSWRKSELHSYQKYDRHTCGKEDVEKVWQLLFQDSILITLFFCEGLP